MYLFAFFFFYTPEVLLVDFFFFQAEDGIRDYKVTGVQTCALPISRRFGPQDAEPRADQCTTHRRAERRASLGRPFRGLARRRLPAPGQCCIERRRRHRTGITSR